MNQFDITQYQLKTFTLIYLHVGDSVLLLKRSSSKTDLPCSWTGLGGKIEFGESLFDSAYREFLEESGLHLLNSEFRGTFQWFDETNTICLTHIIVSSSYEGELITENREGILKWHDIDSLYKIDDLASYQHLFLPKILLDPSFFFSGIGLFENQEMTYSIKAINT